MTWSLTDKSMLGTLDTGVQLKFKILGRDLKNMSTKSSSMPTNVDAKAK